MELRYLFTAHFSDGTTITQTPEDVSMAEPLTRSAYYDVVQRLDDVVSFELKECDPQLPETFRRSWGVNLVDGHFWFGNVQFSPQPVAAPQMVPGGKFRLLYFRDHIATWLGEDTHKYRFGWIYTDPEGKDYIQTIVLD